MIILKAHKQNWIYRSKQRQKCKWFKTEWANKTNHAKNGSGLDTEKEPHWYQILNPVFAETHKPLNLVSSAAETSLINKNFFRHLSGKAS